MINLDVLAYFVVGSVVFLLFLMVFGAVKSHYRSYRVWRDRIKQAKIKKSF